MASSKLMNDLPEKQLDKDNFDPVFRKKDFQKVRRYVIETLDLRRRTQADILKMKQRVRVQHQEVEIQDKEQLEFLKEDPRKQNVDANQ